jgi:hypothetical protein
VVAVKTNRDVWYENLLCQDLVEVERWLSWASEPYRARLAYGSSMGAYAAVRFSNALRFDRVLGFSPLFNIKQAWDTRWKDCWPELSSDICMFELPESSRFEETQHYISPNCEYLLVFDPLDPDLEHIQRYRRLIASQKLKTLALPYAGHPAGHYLLQVGILGDVALSALRNAVFPPIRQAQQKHRVKSPLYLFQLAEHCMRRSHLKWALAVNELLTGLQDHPENYMQACKIFERLGRYPEALAAVDCALSWKGYRYSHHYEGYRKGVLNKMGQA